MAFQLSISLKRLIGLLAAVIVALMILDLVVVITDQLVITSELLTVLQKDLKLLFDFNLEANVPTFFSTIMLFSCATVLAVIALVRKQNGEKFAAHWGFLSFIFYLLSLDEAAQIHEKLGTILRVMFNHANTRPLWIIGGLIVVAIMGYLYKDFMLHLQPRVRWFFIIGAVLFVMGSVGIDAFGSWFILKNYNREHIYYRINVFFEETSEFTGLLTFLYILLWYVREMMNKLTMHINFAGKTVNAKVNDSDTVSSGTLPARPNIAMTSIIESE